MYAAVCFASILAVVFCGREISGHDLPRCAGIRKCRKQLDDLQYIANGEFDQFINLTRFMQFCREKFECSDTTIQNIKQCSGVFHDNSESTVKYKQNLKKFLCADPRRINVALSRSPCAMNSKSFDNAHSALWDCNLYQVQNHGMGHMDTENCRFVKTQNCYIDTYSRYCGPAYGSLQRKILEIILKYHPHCKDK